MLPRLRDHAVERLAVLLPQRPPVVHPVVQDRLEMEAVRRDRAAHAHRRAGDHKSGSGGGMSESASESPGSGRGRSPAAGDEPVLREFAKEAAMPVTGAK